jgi:HK97 family phage major capsid protein
VLRTVEKSDTAEPTTDEKSEDAKPLIQEIEKKYSEQFGEIEETVKSLAEQAEELAGSKDESSREEAEKVTKQLEDLDQRTKSLQAERDREVVNAQIEALGSTAKSLGEFVKAAREPHSDFSLGDFDPAAKPERGPYGPGGELSFYKDAAKALTIGESTEEWKRWEEQLTEKAMTQASGSTGGYLVPPQVSDELIQIREQSNVLRPLFSKIQVNADVLRIAAQTSGLLAGWVAELAEKPESELTFGEISVNVFWKAGMSVVSNQLLRNSNPSIDTLINSELGRRLAALEEIAFISGSGVGQPLGILNTPGVQYSGDGASGGAAFTSTSVDDLLDEIIDAITAIYTEYFGAPNAILMHPRTWARIIKARKEDATAEYAFVVGPGSRQDGARTATDSLPGYTGAPNPTGALFGLPVYTTRNVPTNAGAGDDESRVVVGNFQEGLILDHASIQLDSSEHVYFRTNQTIFRAEDAVGFTAARYPKAFYVIGGTGLAGG